MNIFKKKMTLIAYLFVRLRPAKNVVRYMCKSLASDYTSKRNMVNRSQLNLNLSESACSIFIAQRQGNLVAKSLLVIWKSLRLFLNTTSAVDKCSLPNKDNLMQPTHRQFYQKLKIFLNFFLEFQNLGSILNIFKKKDDAHSLFIWDATACKKRG